MTGRSQVREVHLREQILRSLLMKGRVEPQWRLMATDVNPNETRFLHANDSVANTCPV